MTVPEGTTNLKSRMLIWAKAVLQAGRVGPFSPNFFRQTPFRLTLVFILVYSLTAGAIFTYVYMASAAETRAVAERAVKSRLEVLKNAYAENGVEGVRRELAQDDPTEWFFIKGMFEVWPFAIGVGLWL